ncbi:tetratricopeptide repeat protein 12 [Halyomorpha halys]|uniref:tetratricopeptide repeat protein 12 n=1 Tax=Halyomorpha halys TaxID=286706 RepID=UPI0006D4F042|nr:tetratricopeptide repeat protein 12-like [Halyomorpha halys]
MVMTDEFDEESWNSFVARTDQAAKIIKGLASNDIKKVKHSLKKAEEILGRVKDGTEIKEHLSYVKADRTIINHNALNDKKQEDPSTMTQEAFMRHVEIDAAQRAEQRRYDKVESDRHMKEGNKAFRGEDYDKALSCYNKALDALRDRSILYLNRSLTLLKLGLCQRALKDADMALRITPSSLKGLMYKAEAHYKLGEYEKSDETIIEACEAHPNQIELIKDLQQKWTTPVLSKK